MHIVGALPLLLLITKPCSAGAAGRPSTSKPILNRMKLVLESDKKKASQWTRTESLAHTHMSWKGNWYSNQSRSAHSPADVMMKTERRPTLKNKFRRDKVKGTRRRAPVSHHTHTQSEFYLSPFLHMRERGHHSFVLMKQQLELLLLMSFITLFTDVHPLKSIPHRLYVCICVSAAHYRKREREKRRRWRRLWVSSDWISRQSHTRSLCMPTRRWSSRNSWRYR